jgi:hypothetical protein
VVVRWRWLRMWRNWRCRWGTWGSFAYIWMYW